MSTLSMRLPTELADELSAEGDAETSSSRDLPPELLDAAILAQGAAAAIVLIRSTERARRRIWQWIRTRSNAGSTIAIRLRRDDVALDVDVTTTDEELTRVVGMLFGTDGHGGPE